jgi:hypothetical protein
MRLNAETFSCFIYIPAAEKTIRKHAVTTSKLCPELWKLQMLEPRQPPQAHGCASDCYR